MRAALIIAGLVAFAAIPAQAATAHKQAAHRHVTHARANVHRVHHVRHHAPRQRHPTPHEQAPVGSPVVAVLDDGSNASYWQRGRGGRSGPVEKFAEHVGGDLVAIARRSLNQGNFTGFRGAWCKAATNIWLARGGFRHGPSLRAIDGLHDGVRLSGPRPGALAIRSHHIAVVEAVIGNKVKLINGNFRHRVAESIEPVSLFAYVQPVRM